MGKASLSETQALAELAQLLYSFLPGSGAIYTWREAAQAHGVEQFWVGGSKLPAITQLLEATFESRQNAFCGLILTSLREGMKYRIKKQSPVTREELEQLNVLMLRLHFKIPELHDSSFLKSLPATKLAEKASSVSPTTDAVVPREVIDRLNTLFLTLSVENDPKVRGFGFERFLNELFTVHKLTPRASFRIEGEQIDGSFEWNGSVFLVEARWRAAPANSADLLVLRGKAEKSDWTRGLFISMNGFSEKVSETMRIGRKANLIAMSGQDLMLVLEKRWTLFEALRVKMRHTGETGDVYFPLAEAKK